MTPTSALWYIILFLWAAYLPYGGQFAFNYLRYRKRFTFKATGKAPPVGDHIVFQVTTTSVTENPKMVGGTIERVREACTSLGFRNYSIRTLSDDPRDRSNPFGVDIAMVTPPEYETNAVRKGRSLQYAVEAYRSEPGDKSRKWIFHLDEESVMLPQTLEAVLTFIASGKGTLAEGPIFYPSVFTKNPVTRIADAIRSSTCYFCISTMTGGKAPAHIHGSNLLVRMDVECEVGWALGKTIAEDQLFGLKVFEKYPKMGWHGGVVLESSPRTVTGLVAQRKRWVVGTLQNWKQMAAGVKRSTAMRFGIWGVGFVAALVAVPLWLATFAYVPVKLYNPSASFLTFFFNAPYLTPGQVIFDLFDGRLTGHYLPLHPFETALGFLALPSLLIWMGSYFLGFVYNHSFQFGDTKLRSHLMDVFVMMLSLPVIGVLENYPLVKGLVEYRQGRADWVVTPK
ncbi:MAG TPA: glycosyltransferase family 2 protein [Nitrososphaerales archaeon]|nr:glycosyltransferase family 2 protein [Nitrososphaerales archaeon]